MIDLGLYFGNDAEIARRFDDLPGKVRNRVRDSIGRLALKLARKVQQEKLSGQVLKVQTGRLRRSIRDQVLDEGNVLSGVVSTPVVYGAAQEYGFDGVVNVREHLRRSKAQFSLKAGRKGKEAPGEITVRAHTRHMHLPERSFLRSALQEMEGQGLIRAEMGKALAEATA